MAIYDTAKLSEAQAIAADVVAWLRPAVQRIEIAGSVRREKPFVHDIDLVVWPQVERIEKSVDLFTREIIERPSKLLNSLEARSRRKSGKTISRLERSTETLWPRKLSFYYRQMRIELYVSEPDGSNFGALWQMRTGSEAFNMSLAMRAKKLYLHYKAGYGIFDKDGRRVDNDSEAGIFQVLRLPWYDVTRREDVYHQCGPVIIKEEDLEVKHGRERYDSKAGGDPSTSGHGFSGTSDRPGGF